MDSLKVAAAIIVENKRVFATQRGYGRFKGMWEFPGGKVEEGESPQEALVREIYEELDIKIAIRDLFNTVEYDYPDFHLSMDCFICNFMQGSILLKEHESAEWLSEETIEAVNWLPANIDLVRKIKGELLGKNS